ncbi:hypothetical protein [Streptomyces lincolnensis]|uniref:hypothetical protein n=1 Tax=Streptomyces lincolnensis TaxID=1915 RepID=UPI00126037D7|nr:hypothetical protein [Streptomyces lincolnensis]
MIWVVQPNPSPGNPTVIASSRSQEEEMNRSLEIRASKIFKKEQGEILWPYGLAVPKQRRSQLSPEQYEETAAHVRVAQQVIVDWAEDHGLRCSESGCCPKWLLRNASRQCESDACGKYGSGSRDDESWFDHPVYWIKDGLPAAITSAPYSVSEEDRRRIEQWKESGLVAAFGGPGWYGFGTTQIVMWHPKRLTSVCLAEDADRLLRHSK